VLKGAMTDEGLGTQGRQQYSFREAPVDNNVCFIIHVERSAAINGYM
jgi:hypothetical protein